MVKKEQIDTFWEVFNCSRCKTAMLVITMIIFLGVTYAEMTGTNSSFLQQVAIIVIGYWTGRSSKAKENETAE